MMTFENKDIRVITPMDPTEGQRYIEPVKDKVVKGWDHTYNIYEDYIHLIADKELGQRSTSSMSYDSNDALENWQNRMHEVSFRKCGIITQYMCFVVTEIVELLVYEGLLELYEFLIVFEERVSEPQRLLALEEELVATPAHCLLVGIS